MSTNSSTYMVSVVFDNSTDDAFPEVMTDKFGSYDDAAKFYARRAWEIRSGLDGGEGTFMISLVKLSTTVSRNETVTNEVISTKRPAANCDLDLFPTLYCEMAASCMTFEGETIGSFFDIRRHWTVDGELELFFDSVKFCHLEILAEAVRRAPANLEMVVTPQGDFLRTAVTIRRRNEAEAQLPNSGFRVEMIGSGGDFDDDDDEKYVAEFDDFDKAMSHYYNLRSEIEAGIAPDDFELDDGDSAWLRVVRRKGGQWMRFEGGADPRGVVHFGLAGEDDPDPEFDNDLSRGIEAMARMSNSAAETIAK